MDYSFVATVHVGLLTIDPAGVGVDLNTAAHFVACYTSLMEMTIERQARANMQGLNQALHRNGTPSAYPENRASSVGALVAILRSSGDELPTMRRQRKLLEQYWFALPLDLRNEMREQTETLALMPPIPTFEALVLAGLRILRLSDVSLIVEWNREVKSMVAAVRKLGAAEDRFASETANNRTMIDTESVAQFKRDEFVRISRDEIRERRARRRAST
jgi:hypothetical protein